MGNLLASAPLAILSARAPMNSKFAPNGCSVMVSGGKDTARSPPCAARRRPSAPGGAVWNLHRRSQAVRRHAEEDRPHLLGRDDALPMAHGLRTAHGGEPFGASSIPLCSYSGRSAALRLGFCGAFRAELRAALQKLLGRKQEVSSVSRRTAGAGSSAAPEETTASAALPPAGCGRGGRCRVYPAAFCCRNTDLHRSATYERFVLRASLAITCHTQSWALPALP